MLKSDYNPDYGPDGHDDLKAEQAADCLKPRVFYCNPESGDPLAYLCDLHEPVDPQVLSIIVETELNALEPLNGQETSITFTVKLMSDKEVDALEDF